MTPDEVLARLAAPLSRRRRIGYVLLTLGGLAGAGLIGTLWATEPGLPPRTVAAFAALVAIGLAWAGYGSWVLTRRTPLFALDRVVAGWLGLAAWGVFTAGALAITALRHRASPGLLLVVVGLGLVAVVNLAVARRRRAELLRRKRALSDRHVA